MSTTQNTNSAKSHEKHVIIVGGGFGGLNAAKALASDQRLKITVIDRRNHHLFQPLLYQVATAGLNPGDIAIPIRSVLAGRDNCNVLLGEVKDLNVEKSLLTLDYGSATYDYLILACGAQHSYFGHDEWEPFAPGLKTLEQATEIRRRWLTAFELAEREKDPARIRQLLTFVIIGGGATGVELAGAIGEISRYTLSKDFRNIDPREARVILIEAGPRILAAFDPKLSSHARADLEKLGVTIWTNTRVTKVTSEGVELGGESVQAATVLWGAGVQASSLNKLLGCPMDRQGRVIVGHDLTLPGHTNVFVIGDQASYTEPVQEKSSNSNPNAVQPQPLPGLAPVAMQQGRFVAEQIKRDRASQPRQTFHYHDKGQMATIGRRKAVAQTKLFKFTGFLAWLAWLGVHIIYLVGFKNRAVVILEWAWSYVTFKRGAQLITSRDWRSNDIDSQSTAEQLPKP